MCMSIPAVNYGEEGSMLPLLKSKCVSSPDKPLMFQTGLNPSPQSPAQCMLAYVKAGVCGKQDDIFRQSISF